MNQIIVKETFTPKAEMDYDVMLSNNRKLAAFCQGLLDTPHYKKMGYDGIFAIVQMAQTLGIDPRTALNGELYYLQGRVGMYAEAMCKYIRMRGHSVQTLEWTSTTCTIESRRADNGDYAKVTYTIQDAQKAGLIKAGGPWEKHPMQMLWSRCITLHKKANFADLLALVLTKEEMKDMEDDDSPLVIEAQSVAPVVEESKYITEDEAKELKNLLSQCPEAFEEGFTQYIQDTYKGFETITPKGFVKLKTRFLEKIEEVKLATAEMSNAA